ncbi:MAG: ABC transporter ATP-binding protein [Clostridia bacterium]|nr:ABC transporter ATP-binding protein [Clostridia bacterium]
MDILRAIDISKQFGHSLVLERLSFSLSPGRIYALVGNNGSGKTTLFRMIMGLSFPTQGSLSLFGSQTIHENERARRRIGALIENPILYENASGYQNVNNIRLLKGISSRSAVDEALRKFGLLNKKRLPVRHYSMGMKQRLALACALLGNPELLLLDEPLNGLDPSGMREIETTLLQTVRDNGTTIFISSHYLKQLYGFATDYIFIDQGHLAGSMTASELERKCDLCVYLSVPEGEREAALRILSRTMDNDVRLLENGEICVYGFQEKLDVINNALNRERITLNSIRSSGISLEDYFFQMIGGNRTC